MTNELFLLLLTVATTNHLPSGAVVLPQRTLVNWSTNMWVGVPGYKFEDGTNYVREKLMTFSRQRVQVVTVVTNFEDFQLEKMTTNGALRWNPRQGPPPLPGTPGRQ